MREYNDPLLLGDTPRLVRDRAEFLAERRVDPEIVWEWGYIERVSTGLASLRDFDDDHGAKFLEVARRCLDGAMSADHLERRAPIREDALIPSPTLPQHGHLRHR